jgi:hypothetical protein
MECIDCRDGKFGRVKANHNLKNMEFAVESQDHGEVCFTNIIETSNKPV